MKTCSDCKLDKDLSEYPVRKSKGKSARRGQCKDCYNKYFREYCKTNQKHQDLVKRGKRAKTKLVEDYKLSKGCEICGYKKCYTSLHYHHKNPEEKEFVIGWACSKGLSEERIFAEIEKCSVLCANCHGEVEQGITKLP